MLKTNLKQTENKRATPVAFHRTLLGLSLLALCTQTFAASEPKSDITDSVFTWGMWEYNIAPAAGDFHNLNASPLNPRSAKVTLRTNSNAALSPNGAAELAPNIRPATPPPPPPIITTQPPIVIPTIPAPPAATPPINIAPPPAPNVGTSLGAAPISGTPLNLGF